MRTDMHRRTLLLCAPTLTLLLNAAPALGDIIYSENFEHESLLTQYTGNLTTSSLAAPFGNFLGRFGNETVRLRLESEITGNGNAPSPHPYDITPIHDHLDNGIPQLDQSGGTGSQGSPPLGDNPALNVSDTGGTNDGLYQPGTYSLTFDLYLFDSWDFDWAHGPDSFAVEVNGQRLFDELLTTHDASYNFRPPDEAPGTSAVNSRWYDMIYRDIEIVFTMSEPTDHLDFSFIGTLNQDLNDESWGIDNIRVAFNSRSAAVPSPGGLALLGSGLALGCKRRRKD
ncbi:MAG: hypothetical protein KC996_03495 [Phycisphaerales bacterium]|nr:hypothetical protein [Phycisphaerales bacterium]